MPWYWDIISYVVVFAVGAGFGVFYGKRKLKVLVAIARDKELTLEQKAQRILEVLL